ncbi:MAG TPA: CocE/NonD family hydrolase, partial [Microthrixaceae bacterium]|nr:CocE/NonD family hydrolase [Microthrixaceae bacterium]
MHTTGGVETLTVTGATPGTRLVVRRRNGAEVVTLVADESGNAHLAFVPEHPIVVDSPKALSSMVAAGHPLEPGDYVVTPDDGSAPADVTVIGIHDVPDKSFYDRELPEGYSYMTMRDGVELSVMVRFPNQDLYGPPPWPTVVEYSGYTPSDPDEAQPGTLLANLMGFAAVGVNLRGTGCSGGVFDVFSPAQAADGYDVIETVARQPWVLHHKVGMVGLSYPGITQLYVAATRPPSLAAITPLSVIDDPWRQQWPGGIYNSGFTKAWVAARDLQTSAGGQAWDQRRIEAGDAVAERNQQIRSQNFDFEEFGRASDSFQALQRGRDLSAQIGRIEVPVYLTGAWQDEQTGSRFALMLEDFDDSPEQRYVLFNGHHPDGYSPLVILRWFEFLSFHVARRVPVVNDMIRMFAPAQFAEVFGFSAELEADRFTHHGDDAEAALAEYRAEPRVRLLFENGAGHEVPGATSHRFETSAASFPPEGVHPLRLFLADGGALVFDAPLDAGADRYTDDPDAGEEAYSKELLVDMNQFAKPSVAIHWTRFADEATASYETAPLDAPMVLAGSGHVDLWLRPGTTDTAVQATLTEVRPDGHEVRLQCGWHRPIHTVEDPARSDELRVDYTFAPEDRRALVAGEWVRFRLPIYPLTVLLRRGSRIRLTLSTPGRDHPFWCFENPT